MDNQLKALTKVLTNQLNRNDIVANNLANINSVGFKKDVTFFDVLTQQGAAIQDIKVSTDFSQGIIEDTGNSFDLAITGKGFFVVETEEGPAYTRNGHFTVNAEGLLCTNEQNPVQGEDGYIAITDDGLKTGEFTVHTNGEIFLDDVLINKLKIVDFENYESLSKTTGNSFTTSTGTPVAVESATVLQGRLERSNVDAVNEMIEMIDLQRQFESIQKTINTIDQASQKVTTEVGRYSNG